MRSKEEIEYGNLRRQYKEKFGEGYYILFGDHRPLSEHIEILKEALRTGKPAEMPKYDYERIKREGIML